MKARWQALSARFAALQKREQQIIFAATVIVIVMGGHTFWVEPPALRAASLKKQITQQKMEIQTLQAQLAGLASQLKDPDAPNKQAIAEARTRLAAADLTFAQYDKLLVAPERMAQLLQSIFAHHRGLELVSLQTLPPKPLLAGGGVVKGEGKPDGKSGDTKVGGDAKLPKPAVPPGNPRENLHKHGIEIKMAGNYLDLLGYVAELEQLPQRLLWGGMSLVVTTYPRSELTLTVYTLSRDLTWMKV